MDENREMGSKAIPALFVKYSFLTLIGMLAQCVMVLLEGIIIGNGLGTDGLTVIGLIMPVEYLNLALGGFFAIGISTVAAMYLGKGENEEARKAFAQGMWLTIICVVTLSVTIFAAAVPVARLLGSPDEYVNVTAKFIRIFMVWYPFCTIGQVTIYMVRVDEKPSVGTWAMSLAALAAIIYLYLEVFVFHFGIVGAGHYYGASIGLWAGGFLYFIISRKTLFKMHLADMKLEKKYILPILKIGFPFLLVQLSSTVFSTVMNNMLGKYGSALDIAAFSIISGYVLYILNMVQLSTCGGLQPIASYNYSAKAFDRVSQLIKVGIGGTIAALGVVEVIFFVFTREICTFFGAGSNPEFLEMCVSNTRIVISLCCLGYIASLMSGYFQSVEKVALATILGIAKYIIFSIPAMMLLANTIGISGVWYSQPLSDVFAFALTILFTVWELRKLKAMRA